MVTCFLCGEALPLDEGRVAVAGHPPPARPGAALDPMLRLHPACAVHLAGLLLHDYDTARAKRVPRPRPARGSVSAAERAALTPRETMVLELLATGKTNRQIAIALDLAEKTVKNAVSALLLKLDSATRTEAAMMAVRLGVVER
jgi:DNA-binding NarL/FixJ family response regulator